MTIPEAFLRLIVMCVNTHNDCCNDYNYRLSLLHYCVHVAFDFFIITFLFTNNRFNWLCTILLSFVVTIFIYSFFYIRVTWIRLVQLRHIFHIVLFLFFFSTNDENVRSCFRLLWFYITNIKAYIVNACRYMFT